MAKMSKRGKKRFRTIIVILVLIIIGIILINNNKGNENVEEKNIETETKTESEDENDSEENIEPQNIIEEFVDIVGEGTKLNVSNALNTEKVIDGLTITNIQLTSKNGVSQLLADVVNPTNSKAGDFAVSITALDKDGNEILKIEGYISPIAPGGKTQLSSSVTDDYANAYDFKIEKLR